MHSFLSVRTAGAVRKPLMVVDFVVWHFQIFFPALDNACFV